MRLLEITIENFRSIDKVALRFEHPYTAVCGRNDAGKSNVFRALCLLLQGEASLGRLQWHEDWPRWKKQSSNWRIHVSVKCAVSSVADRGLFNFLHRYLGLKSKSAELQLGVSGTWTSKGLQNEVTIGGRSIADEHVPDVLKRIQTSNALVLYNSAALLAEPAFAPLTLFSNLSAQQKRRYEVIRQSLGKFAGEIAIEQQSRINEWLAEMEFQSQFKIAVVPSTVSLPDVPFQLTMGDDDGNLPLRHWGTGTQNRTKILMAIFLAAGIGRSKEDEVDLTPVLLIEEPESYLHPSAQSEFSELLHDLASQLGVQIVATTHSPHMLTLANVEANVLLERSVEGKAVRATRRTEASGPNWKEAFALTLGLDKDLLEPWEDVLSKGGNDLIMVEGVTDQRYLELLRDMAVGPSQLRFNGQIATYNGCGNLIQGGLPKFLRDKNRRCVITHDLDVQKQVSKALSGAGYKLGVDQIPVGIDSDGKRNMEGLIPPAIVAAVTRDNADLILALVDPVSRESAQQRLKKLCLEEFERRATAGDQTIFEGFRDLANSLNSAFGGKKARRAGG